MGLFRHRNSVGFRPISSQKCGITRQSGLVFRLSQCVVCTDRERICCYLRKDNIVRRLRLSGDCAQKRDFVPSLAETTIQ